MVVGGGSVGVAIFNYRTMACILCGKCVGHVRKCATCLQFVHIFCDEGIGEKNNFV